MTQDSVCSVLDASLQFYCRKQVNQASGVCRRANKAIRFGSHQEHCEVACRALHMAGDLDLRLRENAIATVEANAGSASAWRAEAIKFWNTLDGAETACSAEQLREAHNVCMATCSSRFKRRDLEELQAMARGEPLLPIVQPQFGCRTSSVLKLFASPGSQVLERLYPPGHPRRSARQ